MKLTATLQKSYYGKATVRIENGRIILTSYQTDVVAIDTETHDIVRLWSGWSATTAKHINDFLGQNGFSRFSKKEWLALPVEDAQPVYNVSVGNGFVIHTSPAMLTATECEREIERIKSARPGVYAWYD